LNAASQAKAMEMAERTMDRLGDLGARRGLASPGFAACRDNLRKLFSAQFADVDIAYGDLFHNKEGAQPKGITTRPSTVSEEVRAEMWRSFLSDEFNAPFQAWDYDTNPRLSFYARFGPGFLKAFNRLEGERP
jgi:hypothetical protein